MTYDEALQYLSMRGMEYRRPDNYIGDTHYGTYTAYAIHRDSDALDRANFQVMQDELGTCDEDMDDIDAMTYITRESHWAVGWVDTLRVPEENEQAIIKLAELAERLENYPCLDDDLFTELEMEEYWEAGMEYDEQTGEWVYPDETLDSKDYGELDDDDPIATFRHSNPWAQFGGDDDDASISD